MNILKSAHVINKGKTMSIKDYPSLIKEKGIKYTVLRAFRAFYSHIYKEDPSVLFSFGAPSFNMEPVKGFDIKFRLIEPDEMKKLIDPQISIPDNIIEYRMVKGSRMYGAVWKGRVVDYVWAVSCPGFNDITTGFSIELAPNESYLYDYKGILKGRPDAFRHFGLMKYFMWFIMTSEAKQVRGEPKLYSIVSKKNNISQAFQSRFLNAKIEYDLNLYRCLGRVWVKIKK